ncbi:MAG: dicarboxylate/amino acid:cation symporter [Alphaproteobacteria bacterium TMED87]|nr:dicarboxylate/amino acid:cation symporter [Rhodospirillaceae bacterium]OUV11654.1 MAG: dicarboxylate/amino acid:cation symporter [Alphaproteobacteria bacterium TMED87]
MSRWFEIKLWKRIFIALVLGAIVGFFWGDGAESIRWIGDVFVKLIKMLVVPLVFLTLVSGIVAMGDPKRLGSIGLKAFILYLFTTASAIFVGLIVGTLFEPGSGVDLSSAEVREVQQSIPLTERLFSIIPENPIAALAEGNILAIIVFSILFGTGIILAKEKGKIVGDFFLSASEVILKVTHLVMELAPFGVFALIAWVTGTQGISTLTNILVLAITVYLGCLIHIAFIHGGIIKFFGGLSIRGFFKGIIDPQLVAYSTSSSAATLPVTISSAENNLGIGTPVSSSVIPLGATVNMDGTALYVGIVSLFAAQAFSIPLDLMDYIVIGLTTTMVSIGTASVPSASLFLLAAVLESIGLSAGQTAIIVGFILPFDRILDMMRTVVNVTGDLSVATIVAKSEGELDIDRYNR